MNSRIVRTLVVVSTILLSTVAQVRGEEQPPAWLKPDPIAMRRWQDMRFGMFIHWGPVTLTNQTKYVGEIGWSRGDQTPVEEYDNLYKRFNPTKFDADQWVAIAKAAGMKYIVITAKHHDGFCLWDTQYTDYNIMNSPFKRDVVKELSDACKKQGIAFGTYYSVCDWHHPDFPRTSPGGKTLRETSDLEAYNRFLLAQIKELITKYGPLITIWNDAPQMFDGRGMATIKMVRELQPDILINNRTGDGGDYETPEQKIGIFRMDRPRESCMTVSAHHHWSWGGPNDGVKSLADCLQMLIRCAGGDGNMLLNIGPEPTGAVDPGQVALLKEMGAWLAKYGDTIYATRGGPYVPTKHVVSTRKGNTIYLHILAWPEEVLTLPALPAQIVESRVLTGGEVSVDQTESGIEVSVPVADRQEIDTIVALELDTPAINIDLITIGPQSLAEGKPVTTSNAYRGEGQFAVSEAVDGEESTCWATDVGTSACWLEVNLGKPVTFDHAMIDEWGNANAGIARVKTFELQFQDGSEWKTFFQGTTIGAKHKLTFDPVTARHVRLNIESEGEGEGEHGPTTDEIELFAPTKGEHGPAITEFQLFAPMSHETSP